MSKRDFSSRRFYSVMRVREEHHSIAQIGYGQIIPRMDLKIQSGIGPNAAIHSSDLRRSSTLPTDFRSNDVSPC